jgi:hypothetical protein
MSDELKHVKVSPTDHVGGRLTIQTAKIPMPGLFLSDAKAA